MLLSQKHLRCLGSRLVGYPRGERAAFERWCADGVGKEGKGRERKGQEGNGRERTGKEGKERERTRCSPRTRMLTRMLMVVMSKHMDMQSRRALFCNSLFEQSCIYIFPLLPVCSVEWTV